MMQKILIISLVFFCTYEMNAMTCIGSHILADQQMKRQIFKSILYPIVQAKLKGFPSFEVLSKQRPMSENEYYFLKKTASLDARICCNALENLDRLSEKDIKEYSYPFELSPERMRELEKHDLLCKFYERHENPEFDKELQYACMYAILSEAKRVQTTFEYHYPEKSFEYLAMYPMKSLYKPYLKISKIIEKHERPCRSFWSAKYEFISQENNEK